MEVTVRYPCAAPAHSTPHLMGKCLSKGRATVQPTTRADENAEYRNKWTPGHDTGLPLSSLIPCPGKNRHTLLSPPCRENGQERATERVLHRFASSLSPLPLLSHSLAPAVCVPPTATHSQWLPPTNTFFNKLTGSSQARRQGRGRREGGLRTAVPGAMAYTGGQVPECDRPKHGGRESSAAVARKLLFLITL